MTPTVLVIDSTKTIGLDTTAAVAPALTPEEIRIRKLTDTIIKMQDSIDRVSAFLNNFRSQTILTKPELSLFKNTVNNLGAIRFNLDFTMDTARLADLKENDSLFKIVISKYDKRQKKLESLSNVLNGVSKYIGLGVNVLSVAIASGLQVPAVISTAASVVPK